MTNAGRRRFSATACAFVRLRRAPVFQGQTSSRGSRRTDHVIRVAAVAVVTATRRAAARLHKWTVRATWPDRIRTTLRACAYPRHANSSPTRRTVAPPFRDRPTTSSARRRINAAFSSARANDNHATRLRPIRSITPLTNGHNANPRRKNRTRSTDVREWLNISPRNVPSRRWTFQHNRHVRFVLAKLCRVENTRRRIPVVWTNPSSNDAIISTCHVDLRQLVHHN